ncbi:MAG: RCC1 repeat-containing protein, partial [Chloroflexi bacterium]|nr:RCC1 repeat-containing protein [Chloroflexota bacterium]
MRNVWRYGIRIAILTFIIGTMVAGPTLAAPVGGVAPTSHAPTSQPQSLGSALTHVIQVAAGGDHTCALLEDGRVRCWGANGSGQLGNGSTTSSSTPVDVVNLGGRAKAIATGWAHTCALLMDGQVRCWGRN